MEEIKKLRKENKRLKFTNIILTIYVVLSLVIVLYNNHFFGLY